MGIVDRGQARSFVGIATSERGGDPPTLNEALESAAGAAIEAGLIEAGSGQTAWFEISSIAVELGNQHPRTFSVVVTYQGPGS